MPALWPGFTAQMNAWFCGDAEGGEETRRGKKKETQGKFASG